MILFSESVGAVTTAVAGFCEIVRRTGGPLLHRLGIAVVLAGAIFAGGCTEKMQADRAAFDDAFSAFQAGQWQRSADGFTKFLRSDPTSESRGEVYYYRGEALVRLNRRPEAMADFQRAIGAPARQPILAFSQVAIGNLNYEEGYDVKAVEYYAEAMKGPQDDLPMDLVMLRLGISLQRLGQWPMADKYLDRVVDRFPETAAAVEARRRLHTTAFAIQTGAFTTPSAAQHESERLRASGYEVHLGEAVRNGQVLHTVQVGRARNYVEAQALGRRLAESGFSALIVP